MTGVESEGLMSTTASPAAVAGYWMPNYGILAERDLGSVAGRLWLDPGSRLSGWSIRPGVYSGVELLDHRCGRNFAVDRDRIGHGTDLPALGVQLSAIASGVCNVLVTSDII